MGQNIRITLETISMETVAMRQIHSNQSLAPIALVLLSNQTKSAMVCFGGHYICT